MDVPANEENATDTRQQRGSQWQEVNSQSHDKMQKEEKLVGRLANGAQAADDEETESSDSEDSNLDKYRVDGSWFQARS